MYVKYTILIRCNRKYILVQIAHDMKMKMKKKMYAVRSQTQEKVRIGRVKRKRGGKWGGGVVSDAGRSITANNGQKNKLRITFSGSLI